jgi:uncharacterized protein (TIGR03032 family)
METATMTAEMTNAPDQVDAAAPSRSAPPAPVAFHYTQSDSFVELLTQLRATLLVSTYQANKLLAVRASGPGISTLVRTFERPMGLAVDARRLVIGTRKEIWLLRNAPDIAPRIEPAGQHDACYLPRTSHVTGDIGIHELAWSGDELWMVSTRFSCLATLSPDYSFVPRWQPPFITALAAEDRCHLNGLAMDEGKPRFVTALGTTDTKDGWRADKPHGGCIIDVASGEFVARGLSMPHSPRWYDGRLWVLESGTGSLLLVDRATGRPTRWWACRRFAPPRPWTAFRLPSGAMNWFAASRSSICAAETLPRRWSSKRRSRKRSTYSSCREFAFPK